MDKLISIIVAFLFILILICIITLSLPTVKTILISLGVSLWMNFVCVKSNINENQSNPGELG